VFDSFGEVRGWRLASYVEEFDMRVMAPYSLRMRADGPANGSRHRGRARSSAGRESGA
jgi:hypothetical protein